MKRRIVLAILGASWLVGQTTGDDVVLRAMRDELERSRTLALSNLEKPYYIEYALDDVAGFTVAASLGAVITRGENRVRVPRVRVRVGDYNFDNTNYLLTDLFAGRADNLTIDDNYAVLRRGWWLATDRAYKGALEAIARKRAALKNMTQPEELADFWKSAPAQKIEAVAIKTGGWNAWEERVRSLSSIFGGYPDVLSSSVTFGGTRSLFYLYNSEGTVLRKPEPLLHLQVQAFAYAADGSVIRDSRSLPANAHAEMPGDPELRQTVTEVADNVRALVKAPVGENYSGPVLFEGLAGAQIMAELLIPNLSASRRPIGEPGRSVPHLPSEFEGRVDSRVLPEFIDVVDDPTEKTWNGVSLIGHYEIDEEGVKPKPLTVIEKGRFKTFLLTRLPIRGFEASNGRARMPGPFGARSASASNLFIRSSESVKSAELKARLIKMIGDRSKPYGIIVRRMDFPSSASVEEVRRLMTASSQSGAVRPVSTPVMIYKVYPDGREELIRGVRFRGLNTRALRDISAVSEELTVLHYLNNQAPMAMQLAGGYVAPVSVVAPSVLFDELELERPKDDLPKLPLVPPPPLSTASK